MNKNNTFLSIIVPVYNVSQYLEVAVNSILNQNCKDYEIILVEDCSTDNSRQLCLGITMKHPSIKLICHEKNLGLGGARNTGLTHARGEYITFLDSDDIYHPNFVAGVLSKLREYQGVDVLLTMPKVFNDSTNKIYPWMDDIKYLELPLNQVINASKVPTVCALEVSSCRKVYRKKFLITNGLLFPEKLKFEDFGYHFQVMCLAEKIVLTSIISFYYRIGRPNQITCSKSASRMDICIILQSTYKFLIINNVKDEIIVHFYRWAITFTVWNLTLIDTPHRKEFLDRLNKYWASTKNLHLSSKLFTSYEKTYIRIFKSKFWMHKVFATEYSDKIWSKLAKKFRFVRLFIGDFYE
jgi:glycosyltransferase involved in cell wall biosynthesis